MPRYNYRCVECEHTWEEDHTIAERDIPTGKPCPKCGKPAIEKYLPSTTGLCYTAESGRPKTSDAFKDILRNIKKQHRGSQINV
jgi:putative FmdB family regulatory protein